MWKTPGAVCAESFPTNRNTQEGCVVARTRDFSCGQWLKLRQERPQVYGLDPLLLMRAKIAAVPTARTNWVCTGESVARTSWVLDNMVESDYPNKTL